MDFFDRFLHAFNNSKIEYEHSLPICNEKYEFLFFLDCVTSDNKCFVKTIDKVYVRNINDSTIKCYEASDIIPEKYLANVVNQEIVPLSSIDKELDLEESYYKLYEKYYSNICSSNSTLLFDIEICLKNIPISKCMLEIYAFLMQYYEE